MRTMKLVIAVLLLVLGLATSESSYAYWPYLQSAPEQALIKDNTYFSSIAVSYNGTRGMAYTTMTGTWMTTYVNLNYATLSNGVWTTESIPNSTIVLSPAPTFHNRAVALSYDGDNPVISWITYNYPALRVTKHKKTGGVWQSTVLDSYNWPYANNLVLSIAVDGTSGATAWSRYMANIYSNVVVLNYNNTNIPIINSPVNLYRDVHLTPRSGATGVHLAYTVRDSNNINSTNVHTYDGFTLTTHASIPYGGPRIGLAANSSGVHVAIEDTSSAQIRLYWGPALWFPAGTLQSTWNLGSLVAFPMTTNRKLSAYRSGPSGGVEAMVYDFAGSTWESAIGNVTETCRPYYAISRNALSLNPILRTTRNTGVEQLITAQPY